MNISISIFDFLSFLIPGAIYTASLFVLSLFIYDVDSVIKFITSTSVVHIFVFVLISYILGQVSDSIHWLNPISSYFWKKVKLDKTKNKELILKANEEFGLNLSNRNLRYPILRKLIYLENPELYSIINRYFAVMILLRNVSIATLFLILSIVVLPTAIVGVEAKIISSLLLLIVSTATAYKSAKYWSWSYDAAMEAFVALNIHHCKFKENSNKCVKNGTC